MATRKPAKSKTSAELKLQLEEAKRNLLILSAVHMLKNCTNSFAQQALLLSFTKYKRW